MFFELYARQKREFPILSTAFIMSCLLVTVPSYLNPMWYEVFGGMRSFNSWWQLFTHNFEHGHPYPTGLPAPVHLLVNVTVIATCGVLSERIWEGQGFSCYLLPLSLYPRLVVFRELWGMEPQRLHGPIRRRPLTFCGCGTIIILLSDAARSSPTCSPSLFSVLGA